jgi:molybdopterin converting factor small subunit
MPVKIKYMGILGETTGFPEETINQTGSMKSVMEYIYKTHTDLKGLSHVISHNGTIRHGDITIRDGDELTLIPPAPGG